MQSMLIHGRPWGFWATSAIAALLSVSPAARLDAQELRPGAVLEAVRCTGDPGQSYALYLPSNYTRDVKWPIVYALDAGARGSLAVRRFTSAAEEFGYILAGSNNSRNGPIQAIETAVRTLLADTQARLSIDPARVYIAGFSGGARVAVAVASTLPWRVAGVIACGAGFPRAIEPSASTRFAFFGAVGIEDFNMPELRRLNERLDEIAIPHRLEVFEGGHEWPPEPIAARAIEWMELQAIRSGARTRDSLVIAALFDRMSQTARAHGAGLRFYEEFLAWSAIARDFEGLRDVAGASRRRTELVDSRQFREAVERMSLIDETQIEAERTFHRLMDGANDNAGDPFAGRKLRTFLKNVVKDARDHKRENVRIAARRMAAFCWVELNEALGPAFAAKDHTGSALRLELLTEIRPEDPRVRFHLARAYALAGEKGKALQELGRAVDRGFSDIGQVESNPDFEAIRAEAGFQEILRRLRDQRDSGVLGWGGDGGGFAPDTGPSRFGSSGPGGEGEQRALDGGGHFDGLRECEVPSRRTFPRLSSGPGVLF